MTSTTTPPLSLDLEVLHFKQKQGENLKDAWYRMIEYYRICTIKGGTKILLHNFYVGLNMSHRHLMDFAAKGNFIEIDPNIAYEIIEGVVGILPPQKGLLHTQEGPQVFEKLCEVTICLQKSLEPLKYVSGNIDHMNMLITLYNKRLDALDLKISEYEEKRKEPPRFEQNNIKRTKTKDDNT